MADIILSAFADECAESTEEQLRAMRHHGIDYVEVRHLDGKNVSILSEGELRDARRLFDLFGVGVSAIGSPLGKIRLDEDLAAHLETAKRVFAAAEILGTPLVRVFSFYAPRGENIHALRDDVLDALSRLLALAHEHGVTLCHENEARIYGDTPSRCRELLDAFGGELRCVFDMGNFVLEGGTPYPEAYLLLRNYITYFHIKDALSAGAIVPPGKGEAGIAEILAEHRLYAEKDFFASLEPHLETFKGRNALVGRSFENPYRYGSAKEAFSDAVTKFRGLTL